VPVERGGRPRHRRSPEHVARACFACLAREAERNDVGSRRCPGWDPVALHLVLEPTPVLGAEVQLQEVLKGSPSAFKPGEPVGPNVRHGSDPS